MLTASDFSESDLPKLLSRLGDGSTATDLTTQWGKEKFLEVEASEDDGSVLVVLAPIYLAAPVGPITYTARSEQGPVNAQKICAMYDSFTYFNSDSMGKLLREAAMSKDGG